MFEATPPYAPGHIVDGRFRVTRHLGRGGMGDVYAIVHEVTQHQRALKLLRRELAINAVTVRRFMREASAAGRIGNEHIVETFDGGLLSTGEPYLVMELLDGLSLDGWLDARLPTLGEALDVVEQAARGVHAAHEAGIIHRDLKPDNLFIETREGRPFVKLLDFGISKFVDLTGGGTTQTGALLGTPHYMSPEQFVNGRDVDARSDVYALGLLLYECLTGAHPYPSSSLPELALKVATGEVPPPSEAQPMLPRQVDVVVQHALEKVRDQRCPSAAALAEAVGELRRSLGKDALATRPSLDMSLDALGPTVSSEPPRGRVGATVSLDGEAPESERLEVDATPPARGELDPTEPPTCADSQPEPRSSDPPNPLASEVRGVGAPPRSATPSADARTALAAVGDATPPTAPHSDTLALPPVSTPPPRWLWLVGAAAVVTVVVVFVSSGPPASNLDPMTASSSHGLTPTSLAVSGLAPREEVAPPTASTSATTTSSSARPADALSQPPATPQPSRPGPSARPVEPSPSSALTNTPIPVDDAYDP